MTPVARLLAVASTAAVFGFAGTSWADDDKPAPDKSAEPAPARDTATPASRGRPLLTNRKRRPRKQRRWWESLRRIHKEGEYGGVTPGVVKPYSEQRHWHRRTNRAGQRWSPRLTWVGFQPQGRSARVFLQTTREVPVTQRVEKGVLIVHLEGARFRLRNTLRKVDMRFFDTALFEMKAKRVYARRAYKGRPARKAGIEVRITFKNPVNAGEGKISRAVLKDKFHYIYLDFGPPAK